MYEVWVAYSCSVLFIEVVETIKEVEAIFDEWDQKLDGAIEVSKVSKKVGGDWIRIY